MLVLQVLEEASDRDDTDHRRARGTGSHAPTIGAIVDCTVQQYIHHLLGYEPDMPSCAAIDIEDQLAEAEGRKPDPTPTVEEILDEVLLDYLLQPLKRP